MIQNRRQYSATKKQLRTLLDALEGAREGHGKVPGRVYRAMVAGIESMMGDLRQELREYEELGRASAIRMRSRDDISALLIKGRIARGLTHQQLGEKLGLPAQQIQRYEATGYRSASLKRILEVMGALDLDFQTDVPLRRATGSRKREVVSASS